MAAAPPLTPPPGMDSSAGAPPAAPTTSAAAAPPQPSPADHGTNMAIEVVRMLRAIAQAYPATAPHVAEINNLMREVMASMMSQQQPGEPAAPPG